MSRSGFQKAGFASVAVLAAALLCAGCISGTQDNNNSSLCGNGEVNPGEQCDDGNTIDHDGCNSECQVEGFCGNGVVETGEECDDGNYVDLDGCDATCHAETGCGNGRLEIGEQCDDDNLTDGDGCDALCQDEVPGAVCGNGIHEMGEGCDDGNTASGDGCGPDCYREDGCGDGAVQPPEMCDDGNTVSGDGCSYECRVEFVCGNGYCEDANYETCYLCPQDCCPDCGDGVLDAGEECDDGNNDNGDGCDKGCGDEDGVAVCGNGLWEAGEECEDGNTAIHDGCSDSCEMEFICGDQMCDAHVGENCQRCQIDCCPNCGNGVREIAQGEQCDVQDLGGYVCDDHCYEGGTLGCTAWCTFDFGNCGGTPPSCGDSVAECAEQCDGSDHKGKTCPSVGFTTGTLSCTGGCTLDVSGCSGLVWYLNEDFEDPAEVNQDWVLIGDWGVGTPSGANEEPSSAYEGTNVLGTNIGGDYSPSQAYLTNMAISPNIDLSVATDPKLVFQFSGATSTYQDCMTVFVTNNDGVDWVVLPSPNLPYNDTEGGESCWSGTTAFRDWQKVRYDLSQFAGDQIKIGFSLLASSSTHYSGMHVDAVFISESHLVPVAILNDPNLRRGSEAQPYQAQLLADGGTGSYTWSLQPGGVNNGWLSIDPSTGLLSGTPGASNVGAVEVNVRLEEATHAANFHDVTFHQEIVAPEVMPYETDFEGAHPNDWILDVDWEWGTPSNYGPSSCLNGSSCIATQIDAEHSDSMAYTTCVAEPPPIDLTGAVNPTLSFFQWFYTYNSSDGGNLKISTDGGNNWSLLTPAPVYTGTVSSELAYYGDMQSLGWHRVLADLTPWTGQVVNLRFAFASSSSTHRAGWYVDGVAVTEAADVPVALTTAQNLGYGLIGLPFNRALTADGGPPVLAWTKQAGGTNDSWVNVDPSTGLITGTPQASDQGPVSVIVRVANPSDPSNFDEQTFTADVVTGVWTTDFESGSTGWTFNGNWEWGTPNYSGTRTQFPPTCAMGTSCIGTSMTGDYSNSMTYVGNRAISPSIDLTGAVNPLLVFSAWVALESCCDGANVWVSTNGTTWTLQTSPNIAYNTTISSSAAWNGVSLASWNEFSFDLSAYAGQTIQLAFALHTDGSVVYPGYYVDDIIILD